MSKDGVEVFVSCHVSDMFFFGKRWWSEEKQGVEEGAKSGEEI